MLCLIHFVKIKCAGTRSVKIEDLLLSNYFGSQPYPLKNASFSFDVRRNCSNSKTYILCFVHEITKLPLKSRTKDTFNLKEICFSFGFVTSYYPI